jgi:hypothetical protein
MQNLRSIKKKSVEFKIFDIVFSGETKNKINFDIITEKQWQLKISKIIGEKKIWFLNYVYLKIGFSRENAVLHIFTRKNITHVQGQ